MARASFWLRLGAIFIDAVILMIPIFVIGFLLVMIVGPKFGPVVMVFVQAAIVLAYYFFTEVKTGATIGKQLLKLRVTDINGNTATKDQLTMRVLFKLMTLPLNILAAILLLVSAAVANIVSYVNVVPGMIVLVSGLMALRGNKLAWHDELFKTQVVNTTQPAMSQGFAVMPPNTPQA